MQSTLKILESVNAFYSQSFSQLINVTIAFLAFAGILLPILVALYQKRLFKLEHDKIKSLLEEEMNKNFEENLKILQEEYKEKESELEKKVSEIRNSMNRNLDGAKGGISHVQGNNLVRQDKFNDAFESFVHASFSYIKARDNLNLRRVLMVIKDSCFPKITKDSIEFHDKNFKDFEKLLDDIREYDSNDAFYDLVQELNRSYSAAKKRTPKVESEKGK